MTIIIIITTVHPEVTTRCAQPLPPRFLFPHRLLPSFRPFPPPTSTHGVQGYTRAQYDELLCEIALHPCIVSLWRKFRSLWGLHPHQVVGSKKNKLQGCCALHQRGCSSDSGGRKPHGCARREGSVCPWGYEIKGFLVVAPLRVVPSLSQKPCLCPM